MGTAAQPAATRPHTQHHQHLTAPRSTRYEVEDGTSARGDKYDDAEVFTITMPDGPEEGDLLHLTTGTGMLVMEIPKGAYEGCRLRAEGAIEFMIPDEKFPGDIVTLMTPEGESMPIEIPENTTPGSFLQVAYPVRVLPPDDDEAVDKEGEPERGEGGGSRAFVALLVPSPSPSPSATLPSLAVGGVGQ